MDEWINNSDVKPSGIIRSLPSLALFPSRTRDGIKVRCWKGDRDNADADEGAGNGERGSRKEGDCRFVALWP